MTDLGEKNKKLLEEVKKLKRQIKILKARKIWLGLGRRKRTRTDCFGVPILPKKVEQNILQITQSNST